MHKADVALVALAVLALVLTGVGVAKSDAWTGERTYRYGSASSPLAAQGPTATGSTPTRFAWDAPVNATGLALNVTIAFSGQAVQGGSATVRVSGVAPDGSQLPVQTRSLPIAAGATSSTLSFDYGATWLQEPSKVRDTQAPAARAWDKPIVVLVSVQPPSDLPAASYAFTAALSGEATSYAAS